VLVSSVKSGRSQLVLTDDRMFLGESLHCVKERSSFGKQELLSLLLQLSLPRL